MALALQLLILTHLVGFACVFGGLLAQAGNPEPEITRLIVVGTGIQFVSGTALACVVTVPWPMVGTKIALMAILGGLVLANRRWASIPRGLWLLLTVLAFVEGAVGALWR